MRYVNTEDVLTWGSSDVCDGNYGEPQYLHPQAMRWVLAEKDDELMDGYSIYGNLLNSIRGEGIRSPLEYMTYRGQPILVEGHHRLAAAVRLGLPTVPVKRATTTHPSRGFSILNIRGELDAHNK